MAIIYRTSLKVTRMQAVVTDIGATGKLVIGTAGMATILGTLDMSATAGTVAGAGVLTFNAITNATAGAAGTAAEAKITNGATDIVTGLTVGTSGANINLSSVGVSSGDTLSVTSGPFTHG
jgi:hypothetical protein